MTIHEIGKIVIEKESIDGMTATVDLSRNIYPTLKHIYSMDKEKKFYFVNMIEAKDEQMAEVLNFNFKGHHDIAAMVERAKSLGFAKDKHAKEFVLAMRFMHHVIKKNSDNPLFAEFAPQFEAFKQIVKGKLGCGCECK